MLKIYIQKKNGKVVISQEQVLLKKRLWDSLKEGAIVVETLAIYRRSKTKKQLGAFWGLFCGKVLPELKNNGYDTSYIFHLHHPTGVEIDGELLKEYLYSMCPIFEDGVRITMSKMNTEQMARFFDNCCDFAANQFGVYVPEPDRDWKQKK